MICIWQLVALLLKNFGWKVHRVLGQHWYEDSNRELDRILKLLGELPPPSATN